MKTLFWQRAVRYVLLLYDGSKVWSPKSASSGLAATKMVFLTSRKVFEYVPESREDTDAAQTLTLE